MNNLKRYTLAALAVALFAGPAHAGVVGESSYSQIEVGASTVPSRPRSPHKPGRPGIKAMSLEEALKERNGFVDFQGLQVEARPDSHGVSTVRYNSYLPPSHAKMGVFHFAKVSGADVYFGEWSEKGKFKDGSHTVYYTGDDKDTTVPTSGVVNYAVKGISNYGSKGLLSGTFEVDFMGGFITGSLSNGKSGADRYSFDIGDVDILGTTLSGDTAKVTYGSNQSLNSGVVTNGVVRGRFFGANAKALAGIATFKDNRQFDTAFGGAKQ